MFFANFPNFPNLIKFSVQRQPANAAIKPSAIKLVRIAEAER